MTKAGVWWSSQGGGSAVPPRALTSAAPRRGAVGATAFAGSRHAPGDGCTGTGLPDPALLGPLLGAAGLVLRSTVNGVVAGGGAQGTASRHRGPLRAAPVLPGGVVLLYDAPRTARQRLAALPQPFTLSQTRQALGTTPRVAVPLGELMDQGGLTTRVDPARRRCT
ncbi:SelB C-terminal domain-containing protein [Streptomyces sp. NPDC051597]|uniref:SelB domain-containing protein n=1 Tax=Streptomyces sp. NPDC051597 TaxID=3155049 RepID=UPI00342E9242